MFMYIYMYIHIYICIYIYTYIYIVWGGSYEKQRSGGRAGGCRCAARAARVSPLASPI